MDRNSLITESLLDGIRGAQKRILLSVLLFAVALAFAAIVTLPLYTVLFDATASTGYGTEMVRHFDVVLISEVFQKSRGGLLGTAVMLAWLAPVVFLWKIASAVGLINALRSGAVRSFWEGVGRYTGPGLLLSLLNLIVLGVWLVVTIVVVALFVSLRGSGGAPLLPAAIALALLVVGGAVVGLMQDFARISLICDSRGVVAAWSDGVRYPFRHPKAIALYAVWWPVAALISLLLIRMHVSWASTIQNVWLLFLGHQILLFLRSSLTVAWTGSAVRLHERIRFHEMPLLANAGAFDHDTAPQGDLRS